MSFSAGEVSASPAHGKAFPQFLAFSPGGFRVCVKCVWQGGSTLGLQCGLGGCQEGRLQIVAGLATKVERDAKIVVRPAGVSEKPFDFQRIILGEILGFAPVSENPTQYFWCYRREVLSDMPFCVLPFGCLVLPSPRKNIHI